MGKPANRVQHRREQVLMSGRDIAVCLAAVAVSVATERGFQNAAQPTPNVAAVSSLVFYVVLLGLVFGLARWRRVSLAQLGWRKAPPMWTVLAPAGYVAVAAVEFVLGAVTAVFAGTRTHSAQCDLVQYQLGASATLVILHSVIVAPLVEETIFRGLVFPYLRRYWPFLPAALVSGAFFAAMHLEPRSLLAFTGLGVLFAWLRERTGSIWSSVILHATANAVALLLVAHFGCG
jgi:uncharacterized protein